ncbi:MAG: FAD-binding protein, partial [Peptococcaceae bacterium]|nr:FAD-binding protein [Peptococcaceae bacterium]
MNSPIGKDADVLIVGGGLAGCMAGIRASDFGVKVVVLDKCNTSRSGGATTGVDHCWAYIPGIHGQVFSIEDMVDDHVAFGKGLIDRSLAKMIAEESFERILDLERFGVPM